MARIPNGQISWMARIPNGQELQMIRNRMAKYPKAHESNGQESNCQEYHEEDPLEKRSFGGRFLGEDSLKDDFPGDTGGKIPLQAKGTAVKS
jgi:hypothetical protein